MLDECVSGVGVVDFVVLGEEGRGGEGWIGGGGMGNSSSCSLMNLRQSAYIVRSCS